MKRLRHDQKAGILLAVRDAVFQEIADVEEPITDDANEAAWRTIERQGFEGVDFTLINEAINKEIRAIFSRIYDGIKKGDDQK